VHESRAIIAVLGPRDASAEPMVIELAEAVGGLLANAGYAMAILGSGGAASAAGGAALAAGGRVLAFAAPNMPVADLDQEPGIYDVQTHPSYFAALEKLLEISDAVMVLDPEIGALAALFHVWSYGNTAEGPYRPLVLLGERWPRIVDSLAEAANLDRRTRAMVTFASTAEEAVEALRYYVHPS
jgi:predicted Rossmann-fold nucleotide-binding protein